MKVLTTLAERSYFLGFAALLNSVEKFGTYVDKVIVGYRFELPDWLPALSPTENGQGFRTKEGLEIELVELDSGLHMVHEKPKWFQHLTEVLAPEADEYYFFDSDIIINSRMSFYGEWVKEGVAICGDVNFVFNRFHPIRKKWARIAKNGGRKINNEIDNYYNSGFLGWTSDTATFISDWNDVFSLLAPHSGDMNKFRVFDRTATVLSTNQDSLNLAAMVTEQPISLVGPEGMGFIHGMRLMHHPIGEKPWKRRFILDFFRGLPPRESDIAFWKNVNGSALSPVSPFKNRYKLLLCQALRVVARIYRKPLQ